MSKQKLRTQALTWTLAGALVLGWAPSASASVQSVHSRPSVVQHLSAAPHAALPNAKLRREVFGFVNYFNLGDPNVGYPTWNFSLLSTVAYFAIHVNSGNGHLVNNDAPANLFLYSPTFKNFVAAAHANGTRVIMSINLHDFSTDPFNQTCLGLITPSTQNTIDDSLAWMKSSGIDGININYEGTLTTCGNGLTNREQLTTFTKNLRAAMPAGSYLAIDTFSGSAEDNLEFFDITGLAPYVDSFFVMAYDMDYANYADPPLSCMKSGQTTFSYCMNPVSPLNTYRFNVTKSMTQYTALVASSKVILGQPYYGSRACVGNLTDAHQFPTGKFVATPYIYASTIASQPGVSGFASHRDPSDGVSRWDTWYDTDQQCLREQYYDDVVALGAKYDVVNAMNLRGVGFFTLDYGGGSPELWNEIEGKFTTSTPWYSVGGYLTSGPDASSWGATRSDVFVRGTDNALWHRWWDGAAWSAWETLGGALTADPSAVSWGPNRIDVFVRGTNNALFHRSWDGTTWAPWDSLGGTITSAPDAASWGANHLDVFVRGTDNALWQRAWNGGWGDWIRLGGVLTSDPSAVSSANNRVDVFVRGTDAGLWQRSWNGTSWSWTSLGGVLTSGPDAAACAAGHLDVFAAGSDRGLWQRGFNGTAWSSWQGLRGQWTTDPGAVCSPGTTAISLFERGPDGLLWQTSIPGS